MNASWLVRTRPVPGARLRLLCVPYAGGGASAFAGWADALPADVEVCAVRLPGRESRLLQKPFQDVDAAVAALAEVTEDYCAEPFALFGHSMGALVAFEFTRLLRAAGRRGPEHLFASGRQAPQLPVTRPLIHDLPDAEFADALRDFGGTPEEVLADPRTMSLLAPGLRADFRVNDTYRHRPQPPLDCPVTAFSGRTDPHVAPANVEAWGAQTTGRFTHHRLDGGHLFLHSEREALLGHLGAALRAGREVVLP
ncbi:thioesterase II family protein [Actinokineospora pegani]|uniref:thioesterase II family protein n=1 Tax=Actinokineospora pegani TaxID=2654637 RepID=UPI0012E99308|nr:alpha/beta fold hydrolase [Actinokineospora pegani]